MKKLSQKQVWNSIALDWKKFRDKPRIEVEEFIDSCSGSLLDLGCGSGRHFVKKNGLKFYGVDFSEEMIKLAKNNSEKEGFDVELKVMRDEMVPYEDHFFDNLICIAVLHCVETKEKRIRLLDEIKRILKPSGKAFIQVWSNNHKRVHNKGKETFIPWTYGGKKFERYYYIYDLMELRKEILGGGFKILDEKEDENISFVIQN